eukprot:NODE_82_length_22625_cov_0.476516.p12 type:complete len:189 gc:universal NODE_82_length_22625_cov_0.476516:12714-12148(-)
MSALIIAHPDDECMFFTPIMYKITHVYTLSNGDFDGFGKIREKEFLNSCKCLNVKASIGPLKDGEYWSKQDIMPLVESFMQNNEIHTIYSFDGYGVSGHINHISIYEALKSSNTPFYALESVPLYRKYIGIYDLLFAAFSSNLIISSPKQAFTGYQAMLQHQSQLLWFRYLYLLFSRFIWIATFKKVN